MTATTHPPAGTDSSADQGGRPHPEGGSHGSHPSEKQYVVVALVLGVITAVEVLLSYWKNEGLAGPLMLVGMVLKFGIVAAYFMHLKFDSRTFRRLFISGLSLSVFCYLLMTAMFHSFTDEIEIRPQGPGPVVTSPVTTLPPPASVPTTTASGPAPTTPAG